MFSKHPLISRVVVFLLLPVMIMVSFGIYYGKKSNALLAASISSNEVKEDVIIAYDDYAVPHITSESDLDAFYAVGFAHAQNRLWQMEMDRRTAAGRLSEILGEKGLSFDIFMRTLGLQHNATRIAKNLPDREKQIMSIYAKGVNEGIKALHQLPLEFSYYGYEPEPWTVEDSMLKLQSMALLQALNFEEEVQNFFVFNTFDEAVKRDLLGSIYQAGSADELITLGNSLNQLDATAVEQIMAAIPDDYAHHNSFVGSNAWAVSGKHTLSKKPILANDPHLRNALPSYFYLVDINSKTLKVSGATMPGMPFVLSGTNGHVSWGITSMMSDTQDLYIERLNPNNQNQYELNGKYVDMQVSTETINIKSEPLKRKIPPHKLTIRRTHRGPIIGELSNIGQTFSLRWTGDDQDGGTITSFLNMNYAKNAEQFTAGMATHVAPILNIVYADSDNNIGRIAPGKYPLRSAVVANLPTGGWTSDSDWQGWVPMAQWPANSNPEKGFVVAANHNPLVDDFPYYISASWAPDYRADQISALIQSAISKTDGKVTVQDNMAIQQDTSSRLSIFVKDFLSKEQLTADTQLQSLMRQWDGDMSADNPQAALISLWFAHISRLLLEDDIKRAGRSEGPFYVLLNNINHVAIEKVLSGQYRQLCQYQYKKIQKDCHEVIRWAFEKAVKELKHKLGDDIDDWSFSKLATTHFIHFPFSEARLTGLNEREANKVLKAIYHRKLSGSSSAISVNAKGAMLDNETRFYQVFGAAYRHIVDLGADSKGYYILSTGQSGNILDPHYDDMMMMFDKGEYIKMDHVPSSKAVNIVSTKKASQ